MAVKQYERLTWRKRQCRCNKKFNSVIRKEGSWLPEFDVRTCFRIGDGLPSRDVRLRLAVDRFCDDTALCKVYVTKL